MSLYAVAGGEIDRYVFEIPVDRAGLYAVLVWYSCYQNRPGAVPHTVTDRDGSTTIAVDQSCRTGSAGVMVATWRVHFFAG